MRLETGYWHDFGLDPFNLSDIEEVVPVNKYEHHYKKLRYAVQANLFRPIPGVITGYIFYFDSEEEREKELRILRVKLRLAKEARERDMRLLDDYVKTLM